MNWDPTLYSLVAFLAAGISGVVTAFAWRHRSERAAHAFVGFTVALGIWAFVYGIQLGVPTRNAQLVWQRIGYAVGGTMPTFWLLFTVEYTDRDDVLTRPVTALLAVEPVVFGLLVLTNPYHQLVWTRAEFVSGPSLHALQLSFGLGYAIHITYAYLIVTVGLGLLVLSFVRSDLYRTQTGLLILGLSPAFVANLAFTLRLDWGLLPAVDPTPFAFTLTGAFFGMALFQSDLLDRVPVARKRVLTETDDGFVVLDADERVATLNPTAREILDLSAPADEPIWQGLPDDATDLDAIDGTTFTTTVENRRRTYDVARSTLSDRHGRVVGHVLEFRDVTDRHAYAQRLKISYRVLRHNLRNDMNVIHGWAQQLADERDESDDGPAHRIAQTAEDLIETSEKAHTMLTTTDYANADPKPVAVTDRLDPLLAEFRREYDATIDADVPDLAVLVPDSDLLDTALRNLLENAIEHNDADDPHVRVTADRDGPDHVRIHVSDDGPGIPDVERDVLETGTETPLRHGSGLGLWLVHWSVTAMGGDVSFGTNTPRGSIVTLTLHAPDSTDD